MVDILTDWLGQYRTLAITWLFAHCVSFWVILIKILFFNFWKSQAVRLSVPNRICYLHCTILCKASSMVRVAVFYNCCCLLYKSLHEERVLHSRLLWVIQVTRQTLDIRFVEPCNGPKPVEGKTYCPLRILLMKCMWKIEILWLIVFLVHGRHVSFVVEDCGRVLSFEPPWPGYWAAGPTAGSDQFYRRPLGLHSSAEGDIDLYSQNDDEGSNQQWCSTSKQPELNIFITRKKYH